MVLIMTGPPLRRHPCRLSANANIVFALPLLINHFPRKSHSLRRIYAQGSSPFLLDASNVRLFCLSAGTGDKHKLHCTLLTQKYGHERQTQAPLYPSYAKVWAQETVTSFTVPFFRQSMGTRDSHRLHCTFFSAKVWVRETTPSLTVPFFCHNAFCH